MTDSKPRGVIATRQYLPRRDLSECWSALCDLDCFHSEIVLEDDGTGRLDVFVEWPEAILERANEAASRFASHVKRALDEALLAAAAKVSGAVQTPDAAGHVMPMCKSNDELEAHLQGGGLQGLRPDQLLVVRQLQPYEAASEDADPRLITTPMTHLAQMLVEPRVARVTLVSPSGRTRLRQKSRSTIQACFATVTAPAMAFSSERAPSHPSAAMGRPRATLSAIRTSRST